MSSPLAGSSVTPGSSSRPETPLRDIDPWQDLRQTLGHSRDSSSSQIPAELGNSSPLRRRTLRNGANRASRSGSLSYNESGSEERDDNRARHGQTVHPLGQGSVLVDIQDSRPTLKRLTSETERYVAGSSSSRASEGSTRGSLDLLRMSEADGNTEGREVEVIIHQVKPNESLAGISLLYGIDLPTLRRTNKLWASDTIHLRTHLYIPLEACKWAQASEIFTRGPGEGQVTLTPKPKTTNKGKDRMPGERSGNSMTSDMDNFLIDTSSSDTEEPRASVDTLRPHYSEIESAEGIKRVLDIVRIPNSQLRFFPRQVSAARSTRPSLDQDLRRKSLEKEWTDLNHLSQIKRSSSLREVGPSIHHDLLTLPSPLQSHSSKADEPSIKTRSKMVKLRPPSATHVKPSTGTLADRLSSLFTVPPPPAHMYSPTKHQNYRDLPRRSIESTRTDGGSTTSSPVPPKIEQPEELLEMFPRQSPRRTKSVHGTGLKKYD